MLPILTFLLALRLSTGYDLKQYCQDVATKGGKRPDLFCHPTLNNGFVSCQIDTNGQVARGTELECPDDLFFSTEVKACVKERESDCASNFRDKSLAQELCEAHPAHRQGRPMLICDDENPHSFVNCPPNRAMAAIMSCFGDLMFDETRGECVAERDSDCQGKIESGEPEKGDMRVCPPGLSSNDVRDECHHDPDEPLPPVVCRPRYLYHPEKADWEGARVLCEAERGQLAIITNTAAQGRIETKYGHLKEFWIGLTDIEREGQFRWVNGESLGMTRWYRSQPSKSYPNNEHCGTFNYWGKDGKWGDRNCLDSRPFLCETMVCRPAKSRFPKNYPSNYWGPLLDPYKM